MNETFASSYKATIGADFGSKTIELDGRSVNMYIWDTAGNDLIVAFTPINRFRTREISRLGNTVLQRGRRMHVGHFH